LNHTFLFKICRIAALFLSFLLATSSPLFSGEIGSLGLKIGLNITDYYGSDITDNDQSTRTGLLAGGFLTYKVNSLFSIQPEIFLSMKGGSRLASYEVESYRLYYLEIPILAKLTVPTAGPATPNFFVGPAIALKLGSQRKEVDPSSINNEIKNVDYGFVIGMGIDYEIGYRQFLFELRYHLGTRSIYENIDLKNRTVSLIIGYTL